MLEFGASDMNLFSPALVVSVVKVFLSHTFQLKLQIGIAQIYLDVLEPNRLANGLDLVKLNKHLHAQWPLGLHVKILPHSRCADGHSSTGFENTVDTCKGLFFARRQAECSVGYGNVERVRFDIIKLFNVPVLEGYKGRNSSIFGSCIGVFHFSLGNVNAQNASSVSHVMRCDK